jgi:hypothetical protein
MSQMNGFPPGRLHGSQQACYTKYTVEKMFFEPWPAGIKCLDMRLFHYHYDLFCPQAPKNVTSSFQ